MCFDLRSEVKIAVAVYPTLVFLSKCTKLEILALKDHVIYSTKKRFSKNFPSDSLMLSFYELTWQVLVEGYLTYLL